MAEGGSTYSSSANTVLECRVCHDTYSLEGAKLPRLLQCGHTVCHSCLASLTVQQGATLAGGRNQGRLYCPFDRLPTPLNEEGGVWGLKRNFALVELLEKIQRERDQTRGREGNTNHFEPVTGDPYARERRLGVPCDEDDTHIAVLYCVTCEGHLCVQCSEETHRPRILARHRRVPLSEKPKPKPKCPYHSAYALEFLCQNPECAEENRLMCLLCRDYGRHSGHKHSLLDAEAGQIRHQMEEGLAEFQRFSADLLEWAGRVGRGLHEIDDSFLRQRGNASEHRGNGTGDNARRMVRQYFADLRDLLDAQESAAMSVVEAHVRERVTQLRQQQEDMATLTSQVSTVCLQLEKNLRMDDAKVVAQYPEICHMIESLEKQKTQFADVPNQVNTDSRISLTFTKDNRVHIGPKVEMRVVALGLDGAGKTTILFKMKHNEIVHAVSTIGFNVETLEYKNLKLTMWDVGGLPKLRPLWKHYYLNTQAVIFVVDSSDREKLPEVQSELVKLLAENELKDASLLVLANKQDKEGCLSSEELAQALTLNKLCYGRSWNIQPCDALTGQGLWEGMEWLIRQLLSSTVPPSMGTVSPSGSRLSMIHDV